MDLRPITFDTFPAESGAILPDLYSPVILSFDTEMEKITTEAILQITSSRGYAEGALRWQGNDLYFIPIGGWTPGIRYTLTLSGVIYAADGRELRLAKYVPFFAVSASYAPLLESFSPANDGVTGVYSIGEKILEFHFSSSMDRRSTEDAFTLGNLSAKKFEWFDDDCILRIITDEQLLPWTVYRWNLSDKAQNKEGIPLAKSYTAQFITGEDRLIPEVVKTMPVKLSGGIWQRRGDDLQTGPGWGESIGVEFNKAMDSESVLRAFRFEPSLSGRVEQVSPSFIVFIPERDPLPETLYTLRISADARDKNGLKMGREYLVRFMADIPLLKIISLKADDAPAISGEKIIPGEAYPVPIDIPGGKVLRLTLRFSLPFTTEARVDTAFRIALDCFFPAILPPVSLRFADWLYDDTLRLEWEGLDAGTGGENHYYRLTIPGGKNGIGTGKGSFLEEDFSLYLEAVD
ncbi:hypothetical protein AGMMS49928_11810 [Spirochaetia bacterium]|nr:hypothetical protein AGMMS49928_11810 [Spirochaetia bacterium]